MPRTTSAESPSNAHTAVQLSKRTRALLDALIELDEPIELMIWRPEAARMWGLTACIQDGPTPQETFERTCLSMQFLAMTWIPRIPDDQEAAWERFLARAMGIYTLLTKRMQLPVQIYCTYRSCQPWPLPQPRRRRKRT